MVHIQPDRLKGSAEKNGRKSPYQVTKLATLYPKRLEVIAVKDASTKYWVKGLNT